MTNITNGEGDATVVFIDIIPYPHYYLRVFSMIGCNE